MKVSNKPHLYGQKQRGFTLMEVMVAMLIVAITIGSAVKIMGNASYNASRIKDRTFANWVALNQIAELHITKAWPKTGEKTGDSEMADRKWKWEQKIIKTDDDRMRRIEMSVWPEADKESDPYVTVVGFLAKP